MKGVYILSITNPEMFPLAVAAVNKGYAVSCSEVGLDEETMARLRANNIAIEPLKESCLTADTKIEFVVTPNQMPEEDNPELLKAQELGLFITTYSDFILRMSKDKIRVVVSNTLHPERIFSIVLNNLKMQNLLCDYACLNDIAEIEDRVAISYDARMSLLQNIDYLPNVTDANANAKPHHYYKPHILVMPNMEVPQATDPDEIYSLLEHMVAAIERDGKFIYNKEIPMLEILATTVREDVTAIPLEFGNSQQPQPNVTELDTRYGKVTIAQPDEAYMVDFHTARVICRHLGLNDKDFYKNMAEHYSFITKEENR